jgi:hypothetical protein
MSMHIEWDTATDCNITTASAADANEHWALDASVDAPFVLMLGGAGGGALAIEGTRAELAALARQILDDVRALPDA